jgi:hypothetical protein
MGLQAGEGRSVKFGEGIDEIVERIAVLSGESRRSRPWVEDAVGVMHAKEIVTLGGIFPGFGNVDGNPAHTIEVELGRAVVAGNVASGFDSGSGKPISKRAGMPEARIIPMKRMEVGAVAAL